MIRFRKEEMMISMCGSSVPLWEFLAGILCGLVLSVTLIRLFKLYGLLICLLIIIAGAIIVKTAFIRYGC